MSAKNQKNLIVVGGVVVALVIGTVLLGGFTKSEPAVTETTSQIGACPASGCGGCGMAKADTAACAKTCDSEEDKVCPCGGACPPDCPRPCCAKKCCGHAKQGSCCSSESETDTATQ